MRILTRYLIRSHIGPFFFAISTLTGLLLVNTVARKFQDLAGKGLSVSVIGEFFLLSIPSTLALTVPMAVLVAVLYAFGQLSAENEVTALKASGVNIARQLVPLLVVATMVTFSMVVFMNTVLPNSNHQLANLMVDIARKSPTLQLKEQVINDIQSSDLQTRYYLQAAKIDPKTNRLKDVEIYDLSDPQRFRAIYADSGTMAFNRSRTDLYLTLQDGWINDAGTDNPHAFRRTFFTQQRIRMKGVGNELERVNESYRSDREMSMAMLASDIATSRRELAKLKGEALQASIEAVQSALAGRTGPTPVSPAPSVDPHQAVGPLRDSRAAPAPERHIVVAESARSQTERRQAVADSLAALHRPHAPVHFDLATQRARGRLMSLSDEIHATALRIDQRRVEWQKKLAIPAACMVFVLIGAPLAIRFPRGGVGMVIAVSLAIFGVYYVGLIGGESLGDVGMVAPFWAEWAPNVVFLVLGLFAVARLPYISATSRGGGWEDLWYSTRTALRRPLRVFSR